MCEYPYCERKVYARGWCRGHWEQSRVHGRPVQALHAKTRQAAQAKLLDELMFDGGWLTVDGIKLLLPGVGVDTIKSVLYRMEQRGRVRKRVIELARGPGGRAAKDGVDRRTEWKAV